MENLPENILAEILSRLPIKTILQSKSVCKTWHNLLSTSYFAKLHFSQSPTTTLMIQNELVTHHNSHYPGFLNIVQLEIHETNSSHGSQNSGHQNSVLKLDLATGPAFHKSPLMLVGSVNGWLCLWLYNRYDDTLICNPLTREYMILPKQKYYRQDYAIIVYGFGYSLLTKEYKVIRIFQGDIPADSSSTRRPSLLEAEVYTLGTGKWRSLGHVPYWLGGFSGPFLNGSVHWFVIDNDAPEGLCSFNMETESFELFPSPPKGENGLPGWNRFRCLGVIKGCLCECETVPTGLDIWVMKEYGVKKSWSKDIVVRINEPLVPEWLIWEPVYIIKGLEDGRIFFTCERLWVFGYSQERMEIENFGNSDDADAIDYVPSFVRLGSYELEDVHVFE